MDCRVLARLAAWLVPLALTATLACATLEEVAAGCGNHVVEDSEDCDGIGTYLCGAQDTQHQCRFVWDDTHDCPDGYAASPDKRCRKGSGQLVHSATIETPGVDPQVADFGGDGTIELGMTEPYASALTLYAVNASAAERFAILPIFGVVALGELSGDVSTDIVSSTQPLSNAVCVDASEERGAESAADGSTNAGLSVLRSIGESFSLKVYANGGEAVGFTALPFWLFGGCEVFDLDVLASITVGDSGLEICAVDDCQATRTTLPWAVDLAPRLRLAANNAYGVVSLQGQAALSYVAREGFTSLADEFESPTPITLAGGATVEAGVALVDVNADSLDDVIVLGNDPNDPANPSWLFVLRGRAPIPGEETYPALEGSVLEHWLPIDGWLPADGGLSSFESADINGDTIPDFFLGDRLLVSTGVPVPDDSPEPLSTYYRSECWLTGEVFEGLGKCPGSIQAAVGDVNGDGLDDVVGAGTDVFGAPTIQVVLGGDRLPLVRVDLQSEALGPGYLWRVGLSDFDGDGAADILGAFIPTQDGVPVTSDDPCAATQSLVIAYGVVGSFPEAPSAIAQIPIVRQIASGRFRQPPDGFGDFAVAGLCGSSTTLFGDPYRRVSSPFLFDDDATASFVPREVLIRDVVVSEDDAKDEGDVIVPHADLIVAGETLEGVASVLLLPSAGDAELSLADARVLQPPLGWGNADGDENPRFAFGMEAERNLVAMAGVTFSAGPSEDDMGLELLLAGDWALAAVADSGELQTQQVPFPEPPVSLTLSADEYLQEQQIFARIGTADLNGDTAADFVVVYGAGVSSFDGASSQDVAESDRGNRVVSGVVLALSGGDAYTAKTIAGLDASDDAPVDVVVLDGRLLVVGQQSLYEIDVESGDATWVAALGVGALASEAAVADFSGDGLNDMMIFDGARGYLLEQLPLNP